MESFNAFDQEIWYPFAKLGYTNRLLGISLHTCYNTFLLLILLSALSIGASYIIYNRHSLLAQALLALVRSFVDLSTQTLGWFDHHHTAFVTILFIYILGANWLALIPGAEEPTADINTTLALAIIAFGYKEFYTIATHGIGGYLKEFTHPFILMMPLNIISHFSKVISMAFRLFGNIFGGSIILKLYLGVVGASWLWETIGLATGVNLVVTTFFVIFEGMMQAFVFTMLSLTYLALAITPAQD